jgi:hypothetical protein
VPKTPGQTDVGVFAGNPHLRIAEIAGNPRPDRDRDACLDQLRRLLDMHFDERPD